MPGFIFNIAKGRFLEWSGDTLKMLLLQAEGDVDAMKDADTIAALLAVASVNEADFTNYARETLANVVDSTDDSSNVGFLDADDVSFVNAGGALNNSLVRAVVYRDVDTTDANAVPIAMLDFVATTDGNTIEVTFPVTGFARATD